MKNKEGGKDRGMAVKKSSCTQTSSKLFDTLGTELTSDV